MRNWIYLVLICFLVLQCAASGEKESDYNTDENGNVVFSTDFDSTRIQIRLPKEIKRIKKYNSLHKNLYSSRYAFCVDMHIQSKYFRFFVVDLSTDSIVQRGLVAHGQGSETGKTDSLQFSNIPNSYMTSLGLYKVGSAYQGNFGRSFKLHGLEASNNKAFERFVVLHRYSCVPDDEQYSNICYSLGCPMLSENFFPTIEKYIDKEKKPILLNIYY